MPIKIFGALLLLSAFLLRWGMVRDQMRGFTGPKHRRIFREQNRTRFLLAVYTQGACALICAIAGAACLAHTLLIRR